MNKVTRTLVMTGMAIAASAAIGVGQASAASAAPSSPSASPAASQAAKIKVKSRVIDYYRNGFACERAGNRGERQNRWDDHSCVRIRFGFHRGFYALIARWDNHGGWGNDGHHNHGGGNHGHDNHGGWGNDGHDNHGGGNHGGGNGPWDQKKH